MLPYVFLILLPLVFTLVTVEKGKIYLCGDSNTRKNSIALPLFFILLFILLAVRHESIGRDLPNYKYYFELHSKSTWQQLQTYDMESGFKFFNWLVGHITDSYQWYLAIIAAVSLIPVAKVYLEDRENSYLKIILYVNMSTFILLFSGIRQSLAIAVGMVAYQFVRKKKLIAFLVTVLVCVAIHHSGIMLLVMYPGYYMTLKKKHFYIIVPVIAACYVFNQKIFMFLSTLLANYEEKYESVMQETGAYGMLLLFILFFVFAHVIPDEAKMDQDMLGLRNFLFIAVIIQCFAPIHTLAMRMNYYYILFIPVLIPKVITSAKEDYTQVAVAAKYIMCIFFTAYFLISTYHSYVTGISTLDTIPYVPFWRG